MYTIKATPREIDTLAWLADRYLSADVLYQSIEPTSDDENADRDTVLTYMLTEADAWTFLEALADEDSPGCIPCLDPDTHLARSILALERTVV